MFKAPLHTAIVAAISAFSIAGLAIPAQASETADKPVVMKKEQRNGTTVYCAKQNRTGTRMPQRTCLTKEEWGQRGTAINDEGVAAASKDRADQS